MKLIDAKTVADMLGLKVNTIRVWTFSRKIPHVKLGGAVRYRVDQIEKWIEDRTVPVYPRTINK